MDYSSDSNRILLKFSSIPPGGNCPMGIPLGISLRIPARIPLEIPVKIPAWIPLRFLQERMKILQVFL